MKRNAEHVYPLQELPFRPTVWLAEVPTMLQSGVLVWLYICDIMARYIQFQRCNVESLTCSYYCDSHGVFLAPIAAEILSADLVLPFDEGDYTDAISAGEAEGIRLQVIAWEFEFKYVKVSLCA